MAHGRRACLVLSFLVASVLLETVSSLSTSTTMCSVCKDGSKVPFPDHPINIDGIPVETCGDLELTAGFLAADAHFCESVQAIGTLCGCPIPETACMLCSDGGAVQNPGVVLDSYPASDFLVGSPGGVFMTCEAMEAYLHYHGNPEGDGLCASVQNSAAAVCGCPISSGSDGSSGNGGDDKTDATEIPPPATIPTQPSSPTASPAPSNTPFSQCKVCVNGEDIPLPDRELDLGDLPIDSCSSLASFAALLPDDSFECDGIQSLGILCGCSRPENSCSVCPNGESVPKPNQKLNIFSLMSGVPDMFKTIGDSLTCEMFESTIAVHPEKLVDIHGGVLCTSAQLKSHICGCTPDWRQKILTWSYRMSGLLSLTVRMSYIPVAVVVVVVQSIRLRFCGVKDNVVLF